MLPFTSCSLVKLNRFEFIEINLFLLPSIEVNKFVLLNQQTIISNLKYVFTELRFANKNTFSDFGPYFLEIKFFLVLLPFSKYSDCQKVFKEMKVAQNVEFCILSHPVG